MIQIWKSYVCQQQYSHQKGSKEGNCDGNEGHDHYIDGSVDEAGDPAIGNVPLDHLVFEHVIDWHGICIEVSTLDNANHELSNKKAKLSTSNLSLDRSGINF